MNANLNALNDELLENVTGGSEITENISGTTYDDPLDVGNRMTWCGNCKKMVHYHEYSGGRNICDICGKPVKA